MMIRVSSKRAPRCFRGWGIVRSAPERRTKHWRLCRQADAALIDYRLSENDTGLALLGEMRAIRPGLPAALITAEISAAIRLEAAAMDVEVFAKPVAASAIEAFLARAAASVSFDSGISA